MDFFKQLGHRDRAPTSAITHDRRSERTTDELIGICRGILADGAVSRPEAAFLSGWIERNSDFVDTFPFNHLWKCLPQQSEPARFRYAMARPTIVCVCRRDAIASRGLRAIQRAIGTIDPCPHVGYARSGFGQTNTD